MDKYEFRISLQEINKLISEQRFDEAAAIADTIDWTRVKSAETLCKISDVYKINGEYEKSRSVLVLANTRDPGSDSIIYSLCDLTIYLYGRDGLQSDLTTALGLLTSYQMLQPQNPRRLILQYKFYNVSSVSLQEKIGVLEQLREEKYSAKWGYELARLYEEAGNHDAALAECRSVVNNFGGKYAKNAQDLMSSILGGQEEKAVRRPDGQPQQNTQDSSDTASDIRRNEDTAPEGEPALPRTEDISVSTAQENQALDASLRQNVASGMKDIYAKPYEEKVTEEAGGQYAFVQEEKKEEEAQVEGQISISQVMKEWEKIRGDIRSANDQKRLQKMMEDTGPIMQDFEETAKHGLLEDIEKTVARNQRQARTLVYRDAEGSSYRPQHVREYGYDERAYNEDGQDRYGYEAEDSYMDSAPEYGYADDSYDQPPYEEDAYTGDDGALDSYVEEPYPEESYPEESYPEESYSEEPHSGESYSEEAAAEDHGAQESEKEAAEEEIPAPEPESRESEAEPQTPDQEETVTAQEEEDSEDEAATKRWDVQSVRRAMEIRRAVEERTKKRSAADEEALETAQEPAEDPAPESSYEDREQENTEEVIPEAEETEEYIQAPEHEEPEEVPGSEELPDYTYDEAEPEEAQESEPEEEYHGEADPQMHQNGRKRGADTPSIHSSRTLSAEEKKLFGPFCVVKENRQQLIEALDNISLASWTGNMIITGGEATARRVAQGVLEIERRGDNNFTGKVAKAPGAALNKFSRAKLDATLAKIENGALIIEGASAMTEETLANLQRQLEGREHGLIVILLDTHRAMEDFVSTYEKYLGSFNARIDIKALNDKALVSYGLEYALSKGYSIDEFGQMALSSRVTSLQSPDHHVSMKEVREIVDEAIAHASRKSAKTLVDVISHKRYDKDDRIIIHEKDFQQH